jgi:hypothetical protein
MTQNKDTEKYDILFKDLLKKESSYEFFLKAQSSLKKELKKNQIQSNFYHY